MHDTERVPRALRLFLFAFASWDVTACASLHNYQIDDIDSSQGALTPFQLQVDETGINVHEAISVGKAVVDEESAKRLNTVDGVISLFQVGPSTGNSTLNDHWADGVLEAVRARCPSGKVTGLTTVRETNKYPVVSGEIVTVKGYCVR